mgnify:CR=1 FL=1
MLSIDASTIKQMLLSILSLLVRHILITEEVYADFPTRIDAAKAASPYYAPRLAVQTVSVTGTSDAVSDTLKAIAEKLPV